MATDIVSTDDIHTELGSGLGAEDLTLLGNIRKRTESLARQYVRWNITEDTYTHILPHRGPIGCQLQLPQPYVSDVASVYEDSFSRGGQQADDFSSGTLLTVGDDYWLDYDASGEYSKTGILVRSTQKWPPYDRCVKVTYTSGFDSDALDDGYIFVKDAIINETIARFHYRKERQGATGVSGTVKSERLKDYAISYAVGTDSLAPNSSGLTDVAEAALDPIKFYGFML